MTGSPCGGQLNNNNNSNIKPQWKSQQYLSSTQDPTLTTTCHSLFSCRGDSVCGSLWLRSQDRGWPQLQEGGEVPDPQQHVSVKTSAWQHLGWRSCFPSLLFVRTLHLKTFHRHRHSVINLIWVMRVVWLVQSDRRPTGAFLRRRWRGNSFDITPKTSTYSRDVYWSYQLAHQLAPAPFCPVITFPPTRGDSTIVCYATELWIRYQNKLSKCEERTCFTPVFW